MTPAWPFHQPAGVLLFAADASAVIEGSSSSMGRWIMRMNTNEPPATVSLSCADEIPGSPDEGNHGQGACISLWW